MKRTRTSTAETNTQEGARAFEVIADLATAFSSEARLKIVLLLCQAPRAVDDLATLTGESVANTSQHLQRLLRGGVVTVRKQKLQRIYAIRSAPVAGFIETLFNLGHELSLEVAMAEEAIADPALRATLPLAQVRSETAGQRAAIIDVRDRHEADHTPIPGAVNIPLAELADAVPTLSPQIPYYLVCRGRFCGMASDGVRLLREKGLTAYRLSESPYKIRQSECGDRMSTPASHG